MAPSSYTLRHLGSGLGEFIASRPGLVPCPVHAAELARLEYALCWAFEAGEVAPVEAAYIAHCRIDLQPHLTLLALRTPVDTYWRASERGKRLPTPTDPDPQASRFVAVYRHRLALHVDRLAPAAFSLLKAMGELGALEQAIEQASAPRGALRPIDAAQVSEWFGLCTARGWITRRHHS